MSAAFWFAGGRHYIFIWIAGFPPLALLLLKRKKALIAISVYIVLFTAYIVAFARAWTDTGLDPLAIFNILTSVVVLTILIIYCELGRRDAVSEASGKNALLEDANHALAESTDRLRLILDSTAEAIFGVDIEGKCTFCNASCLELLGYRRDEELIGKDIHTLIHNKRRDGTPLPKQECNIIRTCMEGTATHADDEVFWRGENINFDVEYYSYPQYKNGELIGAVVTFTDNTIKKMQTDQIQYYSSHDSLTGLLNRSYYETVLQRLDIKGSLPLSVIMGDLNGLKLTNDVFGHAAGDELLIRAAEVLKKVCREGDIIARQGGDEFVILLPKTQREDAQQIVRRIQDMLYKGKSDVIRCSMSLGCDTKEKPAESIDNIIKNAENNMYHDKSLNRNKVDADMINAIIMTLYSKFPNEEQHSLNVSEICRSIGEALGLPATEVVQLRRAGLLHDIGMVNIEAEETEDPDGLNGPNGYVSRQHPAIGYRILNLFDSTVNIAEAIYSHHERWDGQGYPRGLKGEEIPLMARIIALAGWYDHLRSNLGEKENVSESLIEALQKEAGTILDPALTEVLIGVIRQQVL
jgi:diguanylate cyclase (GGDEF)-like protein/PAS domain S-box-containing protein/putative nucleotidyltransferase with HDIG domain